MARVLGIDLGTTNSCVAVVESGTPLVVPVDRGNYILPSVVAFKEDGRHLVGRLAKRQAVLSPENTVFAAKRIIGRAYDSDAVQQAMSLMPYSCVPGPRGDARIAIGERAVAVPEVSALILAELRQAAEAHFEDTITKAVITVPAYFNDHQRQATKDAGRIAGLDVLRIINEPTAAALAYGSIHQGTKRRMAVYDLGGGTFDVSVLVAGDDVVEVRATAGDAFLGGRDFDDRILEWLLTYIEREHGTPLYHNKNAVQRLREAAETAKIELSDKDSTTVTLPFLAEKMSGGQLHIDMPLNRQQFESLVSDYLDRTIKLFAETISQASMQPGEIDEVILVGGMTRMPAVQQRVADLIGRAPSTGVHPDLVVAVGAALQGALIEATSPATILLDVTPHNLGIMALGGLAETIIPKDTPIPAQAKKVFTTVRDDQDSVRIVVYQGAHRLVSENQILGEFSLENIRPALRGTVQIEVTFSISEEGLVGVAATDIDTGQAQTIEITAAPTLDDAELLRMISEHQDQLLSALEHSVG